MRLYIPRFYVHGVDANLVRMDRDVDDAGSQECDAIMFPEQFVTGYYSQADPQAIHDRFAAASIRHPSMLCFFGTISEDGYNRQYVYMRGKPVAAYDKVHLFLPNGEGDFWEPGDTYKVLRHGDWIIGLATCNDVRFPEQIRVMKLKHNINMAVYPALWPWRRDSIWSGLLRARAMENGIFVAGCCVAGVDNGHELFDGAGNHVFDPIGDELLPDGRIYTLDRARFNDVIVDTVAQHFDISDAELVDAN